MGFTVTIRPSGRTFATEGDETVLAAALRNGIGLPYGCKNGACGSCKGEILAGGIKFPRTLVTTLRRPDGSEQRVTIEFEKVTVNETFPDNLFAMPSLGGQ